MVNVAKIPNIFVHLYKNLFVSDYFQTDNRSTFLENYYMHVFMRMRQKYLIIERTMSIRICKGVDLKDLELERCDLHTKWCNNSLNSWQTKLRQQDSIVCLNARKHRYMSQRIHCHVKILKCHHMITFIP